MQTAQNHGLYVEIVLPKRTMNYRLHNNYTCISRANEL